MLIGVVVVVVNVTAGMVECLLVAKGFLIGLLLTE